MPKILHSIQDVFATPLPSARLLIVAAPIGATLPNDTVQLDGGVLRLSYLSPRPSAFRVLADCARLLRRIDHAAGEKLSYVLAGHAEAVPGQTDDISWHVGSDGRVTSFCLSAAVAGDPLLPVVTEELAGQMQDDDRRFAFLAAALVGG